MIDAFINEAGKLNGIIIYTKSFPGWDSFAALMTHIRFIREHHQEVACIAFVTDSPIGSIAPKNLDRFLGENFLKGFFSKGRMEPLMRDMPVKVILNEQTALYGSAVFAGTSGG